MISEIGEPILSAIGHVDATRNIIRDPREEEEDDEEPPAHEMVLEADVVHVMAHHETDEEDALVDLDHANLFEEEAEEQVAKPVEAH